MSVFTRRILFLILTLMVIGAFTIALLRDTVGREWLGWQVKYYAAGYGKGGGAPLPKIWAEGIGQTVLLAPPMSERIFGIHQEVLSDFRFSSGALRIDRCQTCHMGIADSDPKMKAESVPQPFRAHPGDFLKTHPPEKFGCTICHQGQGIALTMAAAHGYEYTRSRSGRLEIEDVYHHVDNPLLLGQNIEAACIKCHEGGATRTAKAGKRATDETPHWTHGKKLFGELGCIGCHSLYGEGGKAAPELTEVGSKYPDQFDMRHLKGTKTIATWVREHFENPQEVVQKDEAIGVHFPSDMPTAEQLGMQAQDIADVTTYILSLTTDKVLSSYVVRGEPAREEVLPTARVARGQRLYRKLGCVGCHGVPGNDKDQRKNANAVGGVVPKLANLADKYSRDELREFILRGSYPAKEKENLETPPLWMPTWRERGLAGENLEAVLDYLFTLRSAKKNADTDF